MAIPVGKKAESMTPDAYEREVNGYIFMISVGAVGIMASVCYIIFPLLRKWACRRERRSDEEEEPEPEEEAASPLALRSVDRALKAVGEARAERPAPRERETWRRDEARPTHDTTCLPALPGAQGPRFELQESRRGRQRRKVAEAEEALPPRETASTENSDPPAKA